MIRADDAVAASALFEGLRSRRAVAEPAWLARVRIEAQTRFDTLGVPSRHDEAWKHCDLTPLTKLVWNRAPASPGPAAQIESLGGLAKRVVFVNGCLAVRQSAGQTLPGIIVHDLARAAGEYESVVQKNLFRATDLTQNAFVALNAALFEGGAFVHVPRDRAVEEPLHLVFAAATGEEPVALHPRVLIVLEQGASLSLVEEHVSATNQGYFANPVTEIVLGPGATLRYCKVTHENDACFHIATTGVRQQKDSTFSGTSIVAGGRLVRNDLRLHLQGEGATCVLDGLNVLRGRQFAADHTSIRHETPFCTSQEAYRCILDDDAEGVFNGDVFVAKNAQKTNARQSSRNLLLSERALMNTKPQLEINADDVKCSHGATVGQLNADAVFYLRSRGIDVESARHILVHAFAGEILGRVRPAAFGEALDKLLFDTKSQASGLR